MTHPMAHTPRHPGSIIENTTPDSGRIPGRSGIAGLGIFHPTHHPTDLVARTLKHPASIIEDTTDPGRIPGRSGITGIGIFRPKGPHGKAPNHPGPGEGTVHVGPAGHRMLITSAMSGEAIDTLPGEISGLDSSFIPGRSGIVNLHKVKVHHVHQMVSGLWSANVSYLSSNANWFQRPSQ